MKKSLVLLSGGIDSAVLLWWAKKRKWKTATLSFHFPGRKKQEVRAVKRLREIAGVLENYDIDLPFITRPTEKRNGYIPRRNLMFYAIAASLAEKIGADCILGGHMKTDERIFRDAGKNYLYRLKELIESDRKSGRLIKLIFPFIHAYKKVIIKKGISLGVPFEYTWSCSWDGRRHCRECYSCRERESGFSMAGVKDPL